MKALSLWQPWASLMMTDAKRFETRSWSTNYRGPLVICAAKGGIPKGELIWQMVHWSMQSALGPLVGKPCYLPTDEELKNGTGWKWNGVDAKDLPMGAALGIVELYDCVPTDTLMQSEIRTERFYGNYELGRFAWMTRLVEVFKVPVPCKGKQGLFELDLSERA